MATETTAPAHLVDELTSINATLAPSGVRIENVRAPLRCSSLTESIIGVMRTVDPRDLLQSLDSINGVLAADEIEILGVSDTSSAEIKQLRDERDAEFSAAYVHMVCRMADGQRPGDRSAQAILAGAQKTMEDLAHDVAKLSASWATAELARVNLEAVFEHRNSRVPCHDERV